MRIHYPHERCVPESYRSRNHAFSLFDRSEEKKPVGTVNTYVTELPNHS